MTNDGWGSKWPSGAGWFDKAPEAMGKAIPNDWLTHTSDVANSPQSGLELVSQQQIKDKLKDSWLEVPELTGVDIARGKKTVLTTFENNSMIYTIISPTKIGWDKSENSDKTTIAKIENNIVTKIAELKSQGSNLVDDQKYLYFQCEGCSEILDPQTKSFATLQEHRVNTGWKCIWNMSGMGYKVYCAKCGRCDDYL